MSNFTCHKCIPGSPYLTSVDLLTFAHQIIFCHKEHHHKKQQMGCHMWPQRSLSPNDSSTLPDPCSVITCSDVHLQPALICMTLIACTSRLSCVLHDALVRCLPQHVTLCKISVNCATCVSCMLHDGAFLFSTALCCSVGHTLAGSWSCCKPTDLIICKQDSGHSSGHT